MKVVINGTVRDLADATTVAEVVESTVEGRSPRGTAVAVNGEVVVRNEWGATSLTEGDRIEVLNAIGGG